MSEELLSLSFTLTLNGDESFPLEGGDPFDVVEDGFTGPVEVFVAVLGNVVACDLLLRVEDRKDRSLLILLLAAVGVLDKVAEDELLPNRLNFRCRNGTDWVGVDEGFF